MATGQTILDLMEVFDRGLQLQSGESGVTMGLRAANAAQDYLESLLALQPNNYGSDVGTREIMIDGQPVVEVTVRTGIPLVGLWPSGLQTEVTAHAPLESFDR